MTQVEKRRSRGKLEPPSKSLVLTKIQACDDIPTWVDMGGEIMNGLRRQQSVPILC